MEEVHVMGATSRQRHDERVAVTAPRAAHALQVVCLRGGHRTEDRAGQVPDVDPHLERRRTGEQVRFPGELPGSLEARFDVLARLAFEQPGVFGGHDAHELTCRVELVRVTTRGAHVMERACAVERVARRALIYRDEPPRYVGLAMTHIAANSTHVRLDSHRARIEAPHCRALEVLTLHDTHVLELAQDQLVNGGLIPARDEPPVGGEDLLEPSPPPVHLRGPADVIELPDGTPCDSQARQAHVRAVVWHELLAVERLIGLLPERLDVVLRHGVGEDRALLDEPRDDPPDKPADLLTRGR